MRILVVLILLAFGLQGQQTTVNGQQTSCTVPEPVEGTILESQNLRTSEPQKNSEVLSFLKSSFAF